MNEAIVVCVRSLIAFTTLLILARLLGKQQLSQLTFFDYILGITIGSIAASLSVDLSSRAWPHWIGLVTWGGAVYFVQWAAFRWRDADRYLSGEPVIVIKNGRIMEENMKKVRYTISDLLEQLRDKDVFDITQVDFAVLESNGLLSVLLKSEYRSTTPQDFNIAPSAAGISSQLIYSGVVVDDNLEKNGVDRIWLAQQLRQQGVENPSEVFMASYNKQTGSLYIDKYVDN